MEAGSMLQIVLFLGSLVAALLMGSAALSAVSGERRWRAFARPDDTGARPPDSSGPAFEPLEMEPFTLKWPSEIGRRSTTIPEPPWPSETWDDEYFGVRSRDDVRRVREESMRLDEKRVSAYRHEAMRQRDHQAQSRQDRGEQVEHHRQARVEQKRQAKADKKERREQEQRAHEQAPTRRTAGSTDPTPEQIAALVRKHGLAGAVEQIRAQTGWDFREAAQYLAQVLRDQK